MFELGKVYLTITGAKVRIINRNDRPGYGSVQGDDPLEGRLNGGWRYNRKDRRTDGGHDREMGRVTGTDWAQPDPRNLVPGSEQPYGTLSDAEEARARAGEEASRIEQEEILADLKANRPARLLGAA